MALGRLGHAAAALDRYNAAITAAGPVLHHVGLWDLALSTRADANLFLRAWRQVETSVGEALHGSRAVNSTDAAEEFAHEWLLGHSRGLKRARPTREVSVAWLRDAPLWTAWVNCSEVALLNLSEQTLQGSQGFARKEEAEALPFWTELVSTPRRPVGHRCPCTMRAIAIAMSWVGLRQRRRADRPSPATWSWPRLGRGWRRLVVMSRDVVS